MDLFVLVTPCSFIQARQTRERIGGHLVGNIVPGLFIRPLEYLVLCY